MQSQQASFEEAEESRDAEVDEKVADITNLQNEVQTLKTQKANIDGFYEGMGVGVAKRLEGNTDVAGSFLERTTGGDAELVNGLAQLDEVQGGSVKFNQLIEEGKLVDMGLPSGTLWATCNIDVTQADGFAASPYQYGCSFFSWGNIDGHNPISNSAFDYNWGNVNEQEPYYENQPYGSTQGNTLTGNIPVGRAFDAARANLGVSWRMPTSAEFAELFANIIYIDANGNEVDTTKTDKRVSVNGVMGLYIQSKINGARLFFSCSGNGNGRSWHSRGYLGYYWSSTWNSARYARNLYFYSGIVNPQDNNNRYRGFALRPVISAGITTDDDGHKLIQYRNNVSDATQIFGAGNEPSTVAEFESWLAENVGLKDYYDYTTGEVVNNNMTGIESTGFNLFNPTTGKARIIGAYSDVYGNYYGIRGTYGTLTFEDDLGNVSTVTPDADGKFELDVSGYLSVADAGNDVAVFLWWDGNKTEYEDYDVEIAHLDVRHIYGKKNGTGELVQVWPTGMPRINDIVDKLCIENGAVVAKRPVGEVDLSTLNYQRYDEGTSNDRLMTNIAISNIKKPTQNNINANILASMLVADNATNIYNHVQNRSISVRADGRLQIYDSSNLTPESFKSAMSGVLLYYELATPETYTDLVYMGSEYFADGTPVTLPVNYKVDNWGVETILPKNTSTILTAKPTIKVRYAIDAVEQLDTHSDKIEHLYEGLDELDDAKANTVGVYDDMVVGAAKAIAGNHRLDKEFTSMVVEGADGVAKINEVRGKSLVWNQLVENGNFVDKRVWNLVRATYSVSDNTATVVGVNFTETSTNFIFYKNIALNAGHRYLYKADVYQQESGNIILNTNVTDNINIVQYQIQMGEVGVWKSLYMLFYFATVEGQTQFQLIASNKQQGDVLKVRNCMAIDLTQMFGAGNEPATVEEFESMFPDAYYEYNDGEIINNTTEEFDIYDSEETLKSTLPLNLTTITGKQVGVEDAESEVIFPDGMRRACSVADTLLVDDDGYARRALVKVGSVDLGTLNYRTTKAEGYTRRFFSITDNYFVEEISNNVVCAKYITDKKATNDTTTKDKIVTISNKHVYIHDDSYNDAAAFKSAMAGVELIYELAEYKEYILDEPILMTFKAYHGGTIVQSPQAPNSAPMSMNVTFALDAVGTLNNLPKNYISADSMDAFLAQLGTAMNGTWTKSWDVANNRYCFTFTPNTQGE